MKKLIALGLLAGLLLSALPARAEEDTFELPGFMAGLGMSAGINISIVTSSGVSAAPYSATTDLRVPMLIGRSFRLEPMLGWWHYGYSDEVSGVDVEYTIDSFRFGVGGFYELMHGRTGIIFGAQFGFGYAGSRQDNGGGNEETSDRIDLFLNPTLGVEYFLSRWFSIGAELQLSFTFPSVWDEDEEGNEDEATVYLINTASQLMLRVYF